MAPLRILILGHSFIRRLLVFLRQNFNEVFARNLHIDRDHSIKWHGIGGRTISKVIRHDLGIVEKFAPEIVVIQLGTNNLSSLPPLKLAQLSRAYLVCCMSHTVCKGSVFARLFFAVMLLYSIARLSY